MKIRTERDSDREGIYAVNEYAFPSVLEARLVDLLRENAQPFISLVATEEEQIVGHITFSPVTLYDDPALRLMGLAPMAIAPKSQGRGIGSALVEAGLQRCQLNGSDAVVVLGHPDYYPRFGFEPAAERGLVCEYDVPDDTFLVLELNPGSLDGKTGVISYHPAFAELESAAG